MHSIRGFWMNWERGLVVGSIILFPLFFAFGGEREALFEEGVRLYQEGRYADALDAFRGILQQGYEAGALSFNIGNCYYKLGEMGQAILWYERALKRMPRDSDVQYNLRLANESIVDQFERVEEFVPIRLWRSVVGLFSPPTWLLFVGIFYVLTILGIIGWLLGRHRLLRRMMGRLAWGFGAMCVILAFLFWARLHGEKTHVEAVILADKVDVLSAPQPMGGTELFVIHEGTKVQIDRSSGEWVEVILPDRKVGWVKREVLETI